MRYLIDFLIIFRTTVGHYFFQFTLLTIIMILMLITSSIYRYKDKTLDYKIYYNIYNWMQCSIYMIIFICFIIYLRYLRGGFRLELWVIYLKWSNFFQKVPMLFSIICLQVLLIGILCLIIMRNHLSKELWKRHLYLYFTSQNNAIKNLLKNKINPVAIYQEKKHSFYNYVINKFSGYWSHESVIEKIQKILIIPVSRRCKILSKNYAEFYKISLRFLKLIPMAILIIIIFYELYFNNFVLHVIFYYLPFYFLYSLWKNITNSLSQTNLGFDFVIFERYYEEENVLYINTTEEEDEIIIEYIRRGFRCYLKDLHPINNEKEWNFMADFIVIFIEKRRFVKNNISGFFENPSTGDYFDPKTTKILVENIENEKQTKY